jgi:uncharacterized protein (UPF0297 family)
MNVYDVNGKELDESAIDLEKGYLKNDTRIIAHHEAVEAKDEVWHYDYIEFINTGGIELVYVVDEPACLAAEAYDEVEEILTYVLYTEEELARNEVNKLSGYLASTDYVWFKILEGVSTVEDYKDIFDKRKEVRERISVLKDRYKL